jgi:hypothetical protein
MKTSLAGHPAHLVTTFNRLHSADACASGYGKLANFIRDNLGVVPKDFGMDRPIPVALILESNGIDDALWVLRNAHCGDGDAERNRFLRLLACDFAEHVLPIFEKHHSDDNRPRQAIEAARLFEDGKVSYKEMATARAAARAAAYAAYAAADAAYAAYAARADAAAYAARADAADAARLTEKQWQSDRFQAALEAEAARIASTFSEGSESGSEVAGA